MILALLLAASGSDVRVCDKASAVQCASVSASGGISVTGSGTFDISDRVGRALGVVTIGAGSAVIGHVIADTGSTTAVTGNVTAVQPTGTNLHAVLDTTSTTAATQATAANLNAQVVGAAADGSAASGNPVAVAGKGFNASNFTPRYCDKIATVTTLSTTTTVQQIAAVANQKIYICGYYILASTATTAVTLKWTEGTGSNCVTGLANVTPAIFTTPTAAPTTANFTLGPWGNGAIPWMVTAGDALCITQSSGANATTLSGVIFYTQN